MAELTRTLDDTVRRERGRIVGGLLRLCGSLDAAEEAFQEAVLAALQAWRAGVPDNPGAWLMTSAKNRARDARRHAVVADAKAPMLVENDVGDAGDPDIDTLADDYLRLILTCCHPVLAAENQIALTLKVVCDFSTDEIARAFVVAEESISQRILRAKRAIADAKLDYASPVRAESAARVDAALGVVYAMFNEGHIAHAGESLMRIDLQVEAIRLGRLLCDLDPTNAETFGLLALMCFAAARAATRFDDEGLPVLLEAQDRARWNTALVREGLMALQHARTLDQRGAYQLEAEIAAVHVAAPAWSATNWAAIVVLYDELLAVAPSPIVSLNRAIALSMKAGPGAGLTALEPLTRALADYHLFYAARADMLERTGKDPRPDLRRALGLATNESERKLLERRLDKI
jgi:RNA polymerase sigma-70 factor (ECF subfamily)